MAVRTIHRLPDERHMESRRRRTPPTISPPSPIAVPSRPVTAGSGPYPLASGAGNEPVTVVHLAAELAPFARTGGLGEAVSSLAHYQARSGIRSIIMMPLYKQVTEVATDLVPIGDPFPVIVGPRHEVARLYESRALMDNPRQGKPRILFIHNAEYFGREQIYGDSKGDYKDNHKRF